MIRTQKKRKLQIYQKNLDLNQAFRPDILKYLGVFSKYLACRSDKHAENLHANDSTSQHSAEPVTCVCSRKQTNRPFLSALFTRQFLGLYVQTVDGMKHEIARYHVAVGLYPALRIQAPRDVRQVVQHVESVQHKGEPALHHPFGQTADITPQKKITQRNRQRPRTGESGSRHAGKNIQKPPRRWVEVSVCS